MKKNQKIFFRFVAIASILALCGAKGVKLVDARNKAYKIVETHSGDEESMHDGMIVAHRGFSSLAPDNTYESVELALESPCVDAVEIDVRMTHDGILVLHHDSTLSIEDLTIRIEDLDLEEADLENLNKRYANFNVENYLYDDTLFLIERYLTKDYDDQELITFGAFSKWYSFDKPLIVDVKCSKPNERFENELNRLLGEHKDKVFIQCYSYEFLKSMQEHYPDFKYLFLVRMGKDIPLMEDDSFAGYTVRASLLKSIEMKPDKLYFFYTVNSSKKLYSTIALLDDKFNENVGFISDVPDYMCALEENVKSLGSKHERRNNSRSKSQN